MGSVARTLKGFSIFNPTPRTVGDLNLVMEDMESNIDRRVGTFSELEAIQYKYPGMLAQVAVEFGLETNSLWVYGGASKGWTRVTDPVSAALSTVLDYSAGWVEAASLNITPQVYRAGRRLSGYFSAQKTSNAALGHAEVPIVFKVGNRPITNHPVAVQWGATPASMGAVTIASNGNLTILSPPAATSVGGYFDFITA